MSTNPYWIGPHPERKTHMNNSNLNVVTGAFSYTGKYIASKLLSMGKEVRTLTGHPNRATPFGDQVKALPLRFDAPEELVNSLRGATTLFNTYWIRFPHGKVTFDVALENTKILIRAVQLAGVQQIVHISITNASPDSTLAYFRGKALAEEAICGSGLAYTIIRPTLIFGAEDILSGISHINLLEPRQCTTKSCGESKAYTGQRTCQRWTTELDTRRKPKAAHIAFLWSPGRMGTPDHHPAVQSVAIRLNPPLHHTRR